MVTVQPQIWLGGILIAYAVCFRVMSLKIKHSLWDKQFEPQSHLDLAAGIYHLKISNRITISFIDLISGLKPDLHQWDICQYVWRRILNLQGLKDSWLESTFLC